jgi:hypothetical protein
MLNQTESAGIFANERPNKEWKSGPKLYFHSPCSLILVLAVNSAFAQDIPAASPARESDSPTKTNSSLRGGRSA